MRWRAVDRERSTGAAASRGRCSAAAVSRRSGTFAEVIANHLLSGGQVGEAFPMLLVAETTLEGRTARRSSCLRRRNEPGRPRPLTSMRPHRRNTTGGSMRWGRLRRMGEIESPSMLGGRASGSPPTGRRRRWRGSGRRRCARSHWVRWWRLLGRKRWRPAGDRCGLGPQRLTEARLSRGCRGRASAWTELQELGREMGAGASTPVDGGLGQTTLCRGDSSKAATSSRTRSFDCATRRAVCCPRPCCASLS